MARLRSSGLELNPTSADHEGFEFMSGVAETTVIRSGVYSREGAASNANFRIKYRAADTQESMYYRTYLRVERATSALGDILRIQNNAVSTIISIRMNTTRTLELWNTEDSAQVGSDSAALALDTWYRLEISLDTTTLATTSVSARIDGVEFASGTINLASAVNAFSPMGFETFATAPIIYFDDIAINDSSGSFQNSWPGEGEIIHLRPNAAGDTGQWLDGTGTTFAEVDEVTPDDITTYIDTPDIDQISEFNLDATPAALASDDTINCVQVGVRYAQESSGTTARIAVQIRSASGGTVEQSGNITQTNDSNWNTNNSAAPRNYALTLYDLPGASTTAWTKSTLDTAQIGVDRTVDDGLNSSRVSTLWLLVDHKPAAGGSVTQDKLLLTNFSGKAMFTTPS